MSRFESNFIFAFTYLVSIFVLAILFYGVFEGEGIYFLYYKIIIGFASVFGTFYVYFFRRVK